MTMVGDVFTARATATGGMVNSRTRLKGVYVTGTGTVTFRDGGAGGTVRAVFDSTGTHAIVVPANGVLFSTDLHATLTGVTSVTIFYG
jgi:hypothetical protein